MKRPRFFGWFMLFTVRRRFGGSGSLFGFEFRQTFFQRDDFLNDRVGQVALIHLVVNANTVAANHAGGNADRGAVFGNVPNDDRVGSDLAVGTDLDGA